MRINIAKLMIALGFGVVVGVFCYAMASEECSRNLISLAVAAISMFASFTTVFAIDYNCGNRDVNIKTAAWIFTLLVLVSNVIISCFDYNGLLYATIIFFLVLANFAVIMSLYNRK